MTELNLQELWDSAHPALPEDLQGFWTVRILSGPVPDFSWAGHGKLFPRKTEEGSKKGFNQVLGFFRFGYFQAQNNGGAGLVLDYSRGLRRNWILGSMRDHVRKVSPEYFLGKYGMVRSGVWEDKGWFSLEARK